MKTSRAPRRIQRKRTKGWKMPDGAVYVGRPTKWGNPWTVAEWAESMSHLHSSFSGSTLSRDELNRQGRDIAACCFYSAMVDRIGDPDYLEHEHPGFYPPIDQIRDELRGKDLACWCPLDEDCHADTLLKIANGGDL